MIRRASAGCMQRTLHGRRPARDHDLDIDWLFVAGSPRTSNARWRRDGAPDLRECTCRACRTNRSSRAECRRSPAWSVRGFARSNRSAHGHAHSRPTSFLCFAFRPIRRRLSSTTRVWMIGARWFGRSFPRGITIGGCRFMQRLYVRQRCCTRRGACVTVFY